MRFKKSPQLPGAGRTRVWHHHGSHTPPSPGAISILLVKWPITPNKSDGSTYVKELTPLCQFIGQPVSGPRIESKACHQYILENERKRLYLFY